MKKLSKQEKLRHLELEFNKMDVNNDGAIQLQELQYHLDQNNNGQPFDRTVANQLFNSIDKTTDGLITKQEFIRVWIESENRIREKLDRNIAEMRKAKLLKEENVS
mgnify:CR=1 FL=1